MINARLIFTIEFIVITWSLSFLLSAAESVPIKSTTFADYGQQAFNNLLRDYYVDGKWKATPSAHPKNHDWGDDSLTYALYLRWQVSKDQTIPPLLEALAASMKKVPPPCHDPKSLWSDEFLWDSVAGAYEYKVTGSHTALQKSKAGFDYVDQAVPGFFSGGAAPGIYFQRPDHASGGLKTLETDSNYVKAALLLYDCTKDATYLTKAKLHYAAIRQYYLDPDGSNLYSVLIFDTGNAYHQVKGRYYGSVNGIMIDNGLKLAAYTGDHIYLDEALATAHAVDSNLSDACGIYTDLQAENDVVEPLVAAMYELWSEQGQIFAKDWIMRNAAASVSAIQPTTGAYGRFFDGPPPMGTVSEHQCNGGFALAFVAAAIDPTGVPTPGAWESAVQHDIDITTTSLPAPITFTGSGIALIGTMGEQKKEGGHARVFIDGVETKDTTGIWQNKSTTGVIPQSILFAWQWPHSGDHTITIKPADHNAKEGDTFVHIQSYLVKP